ncbi:unnamed protein product [Bemisia tabaci]|uniref:Cryptochrome DASH n=1 Tax=Bemisia tabaci TaxID=7038 RepID=A0A9P0AGH2_BEMTA|nr:unnamed protein product [Bemisia tabaci]
MASPKILIYLLRRDLRVHDNPIFHKLTSMSSQANAPFTHLLPLYVFPAHQIEVSGFLSSSDEKSPYPEARSKVGKFWRCGQLRAKFLAETVWDLKQNLETIGSGLEIRVGMLHDVVKQLVEGFKSKGVQVKGLWMTSEEGYEEKAEERQVRKIIVNAGGDFHLWKDEKYFIDDDDIPFDDPQKYPDVFTKYRNTVEPLREAPRKVLPTPKKLPPLPQNIPPQAHPFKIPGNLKDLIAALQKPLDAGLGLKNPPQMPSAGASSAVPFAGGATSGQKRLKHLIESGAMTRYKDTRNGMVGTDYSSKLSLWLALGSLTAREVHSALIDFEEGKTDVGKGAEGYGKGENKGTTHMRFELLWRDYMRLCTRKYGSRLFLVGGFRNARNIQWKHDNSIMQRWLEGTTGIGLVDAAQRELFLTGFTSNRARQNVASFLTKHLEQDWRLGAEWYECNLVDYDVSSNWGNWQYTAGVGNDPREDRKFNPVKQASDYDPKAEFVKAWIPEVRELQPEEAWQCWKASYAAKQKPGLRGNIMAERPLAKISFTPRSGGNDGHRGGGRSRGRAQWF